ncbi:MAG: Gfo/Idh/MocA family oxidoreductase [Cypionkella sp.]|uniref:Gfo/Idh/MocA family protein n=1 Tax=Cypionkella sp. TaxID=2811411 RepID=UPI002AB84C9D|nr:Gfo/Idh/MocA family oxidoreductase [Cypionkella sp.]MDZ4309640.1 Gfo/Idh/MocA family oxidoreductase [Cypionkella sp.]
MKIAFVGCGFVFDIYMRTIGAHPELKVAGVFDINPDRMDRVSRHYGFRAYANYEEILRDTEVTAIINLTNIGAHYEVSKRAIEAGKHVYSEKPLTTDAAQSRKLFELAAVNGVRLYCAPCNIYSDSVRTLFDVVEQGGIGKPMLVYAELDDNPIHLMEFETVRSPSGAPWPLDEEIYEGCTFEHVGYHLVWICGLLGPAVSVIAFSSELIEHKTLGLPARVGTPDYSVACLHFANGATARITCSVVAPRDHRMRVIGTEGEVISDSYRQYQSPVHLERYSKGSLTARKFQTLRNNPFLGRLFGIGGKKLRLVRHWKSAAVESDQQVRSSMRQRLIEWLRRREVYAQDKFLGIAEMAREIKSGAPAYLTPDFILHVNELTLLIQRAGTEGIALRPTTSFAPIGPIPGGKSTGRNYIGENRPRMFERLLFR